MSRDTPSKGQFSADCIQASSSMKKKKTLPFFFDFWGEEEGIVGVESLCVNNGNVKFNLACTVT